MKTVLWISRHSMTQLQYADLERCLHDQIHLVNFGDTVTDVEILRPLVQQTDAVAAVLPTELLAALLPMLGTRPLLQSVAHRIPTGTLRTLPDGTTEPEFRFEHRHWQQILQLELETRIL